MVVGAALKEAKGIFGKFGVFFKILIGFVILIAVAGGIYFGLKAAGVIEEDAGIGRLRDMLIRERPAVPTEAAPTPEAPPAEAVPEVPPAEVPPEEVTEIAMPTPITPTKEKSAVTKFLGNNWMYMLIVLLGLGVSFVGVITYRKRRLVKKEEKLKHRTLKEIVWEELKEIIHLHNEKKHVYAELRHIVARFPCYDEKLHETARKAPHELMSDEYIGFVEKYVELVGELIELSGELVTRIQALKSVITALNQAKPVASFDAIIRAIEQYLDFESKQKENIIEPTKPLIPALKAISKKQRVGVIALERLDYKTLIDKFREEVLGEGNKISLYSRELGLHFVLLGRLKPFIVELEREADKLRSLIRTIIQGSNRYKNPVIARQIYDATKKVRFATMQDVRSEIKPEYGITHSIKITYDGEEYDIKIILSRHHKDLDKHVIGNSVVFDTAIFEIAGNKYTQDIQVVINFANDPNTEYAKLKLVCEGIISKKLKLPLEKLELGVINKPRDKRFTEVFRLYSKIFTLPEERTDFDGFNGVMELNGREDAKIAIGRAEETWIYAKYKDKVIGAVNFDVYVMPPKIARKGVQGTNMIIYLFVAPEYRMHGVGGHLLNLANRYTKNFIRGIADPIQLLAETSNDAVPILSFCEQNNVYAMTLDQYGKDNEAAKIDQCDRLKWWVHKGYRQLKFSYVQPPLERGADPCYYMTLNVDSKNPVDADIVLQHLEMFFYYTIFCGPGSADDEDCKKQRKELERLGSVKVIEPDFKKLKEEVYELISKKSSLSKEEWEEVTIGELLGQTPFLGVSEIDAGDSGRVHLGVAKIQDVEVEGEKYKELFLGVLDKPVAKPPKPVEVLSEPVYLPENMWKYGKYNRVGLGWIKTFTYKRENSRLIVTDLENHAADLIVAYFDTGMEQPAIALIKRKKEPFEGKIAIPGGMVDESEFGDWKKSAIREFEEETQRGGREIKLDEDKLIDLGEFRDKWKGKDRDPRDPNTISHAYWTVLVQEDVGVRPDLKAGDDALKAGWYGLDWELNEKNTINNFIKKYDFAFDHERIIGGALRPIAKLAILFGYLGEYGIHFKNTNAEINAYTPTTIFQGVLSRTKLMDPVLIDKFFAGRLNDKKVVIEPRPGQFHCVLTIDKLEGKKIVFKEDVEAYYKEQDKYVRTGFKLSKREVSSLGDIAKIEEECKRQYEKEFIKRLKEEAIRIIGKATKAVYYQLDGIPVEINTVDMPKFMKFLRLCGDNPTLSTLPEVRSLVKDKWIETLKGGYFVYYRIVDLNADEVSLDSMVITTLGKEKELRYKIDLKPIQVVKVDELENKLGELFREGYAQSENRVYLINKINGMFKPFVKDISKTERGYLIDDLRPVFKEILKESSVNLYDFRFALGVKATQNLVLSIRKGLVELKYIIENVDQHNNITLVKPRILVAGKKVISVDGKRVFSLENLSSLSNRQIIEDVINVVAKPTEVRETIVNELKEHNKITPKGREEIKGTMYEFFSLATGSGFDRLPTFLISNPFVRIEDFRGDLVGRLIRGYGKYGMVGKYTPHLHISRVKATDKGYFLEIERIFLTHIKFLTRKKEVIEVITPGAEFKYVTAQLKGNFNALIVELQDKGIIQNT